MITYVQFKIRFHVSENLFKTFPYGSHIKSMLYYPPKSVFTAGENFMGEYFENNSFLNPLNH
jgi:hypothetical protein